MITPEIKRLLDYADESPQAAKVLIDSGFIGFSAAQSYYTMFYLTEALLLSKGLKFSSHSAVIAAYGKEFSKTNLLDIKFHRRFITVRAKIFQMKTRSNHSNGQKSLCRLSKII